MRASLLLPCALAALTLPPSWGWSAVVLGLALGARRLEAAGLVLLCLAAAIGAAQRPAPAPEPGAALLEGRWREPPGRPAGLDVPGGRIGLRWASGVRPPAPGTPLRAWVRVAAERDPLVVSTATLGPPRGALADRWALAAQARVRRLVAPDRRGLVSALLLGRRQDLPFPVLADCVRTGTMHLLALSGLHAGLLLCAVRVLCRLGGAPHGAAGLVCLLAFVLLAGPRAPLVRASLGALLWGAATLCGRRVSPLLRLGTVALLLFAWMPGWQHQLSAQLSFLAVAGLLGAARQAPGAAALWFAPAGAFLATAPLCAEVFGRVQPLGVVWTPLLVPLVAGVLGLGLVAVLPGTLFSRLDPVVGPLLDGCADLLQRGLQLMAAISPEPRHPSALPLPGLLLSLLVVGLLALPRPRRPGWQPRWVR